MSLTPADHKALAALPRYAPMRTERMEPRLVLQHEAYQTRPLHWPTVMQYAAAMREDVEFPPIKVRESGDGRVLISGAHRLHAAARAGQWITAEVYAVSHAEAVHIAIADNLGHGRALKKNDHQKALLMFVDAGLHMDARRRSLSLRALSAAACGSVIAPNTIKSWLMKHRPKVYRAMTQRCAEGETRGPYNLEEHCERKAKQVAHNALAVFNSAMARVTDPVERGALLAVAQDVLRQATTDAPYKHISPMQDF